MLKQNATLFGGWLSAFIAMVALFIAAPNAGADDWGLEVGTKAPGFNLKDQNDQDVMQDEIRTLTITEQTANRFLRLVHGNTVNSVLEAASEKLTISSFTKSNAIKDTAQLLTGTALTLNLIVPDDFDYCTLDNLA